MATVDINDKSTKNTLSASEFNQILDAIKDGTKDVNTRKLTVSSSSDEASIAVTPSGDAGNSESSGGAIYLDNTNNPGIGLNVYTNEDSVADGDLVNFFATNTSYDRSVLRVKNDGVGKALNLTQTITSGGAGEAAAINSSDEDNTALGVTGVPTGKGVVKITHNKSGGSDSAGSALSINVAQATSSAKAIFINQDGQGNCEQVIHNYSDSQDVKTVVKDGGASNGFSERWLNGISRHGITLGNGSTTYRLWVDDSGSLRIHNTDPSSQDDGTVVGAQS